MKTAKLRHRFEVYEKQLTDDGYGGSEVQWFSLGCRWGNVTKKIGNESYENGKVTWITQFEIEVRDNIGIDWDTSMSVKYKGDILNFLGYADKTQQGNRNYLLFNKGNPSDFPDNVSTGMFDQEGLQLYDQEGNVMYNQEGV